MALGGVLGNEQHEDERDRLGVGRVEGHRLGESHEGADSLFQSLDASVGDGDAVTEPGGTEALARKQAVEDEGARDSLVVLEQQTRLLEHALLAGDVEIENDVGGREEFRYEVHCASRRPARVARLSLVQPKNDACYTRMGAGRQYGGPMRQPAESRCFRAS